MLNTIVNWAFSKSQHGTQVTGPAGEPITVPANIDDITPYLLRPKQLDEGVKYRRTPNRVAPIWPMDSYVDVVVTLSPSFVPTTLSEVPAEMVILEEQRFNIGNYSDKRSIDAEFTVPARVQNNGTLWGHFYIGLHGSQLDPKRPGYDSGSAYYFSYPLTQYLPKKKIAKTRNLLDDLPEPVEVEEVDEGPVVIASYYHPNTSLSFIPDTGVMEYDMQPPAVRQYLYLEVRH